MANLMVKKKYPVRFILFLCTLIFINAGCHEIDKNRGGGSQFSIEDTDNVSRIILQSNGNELMLATDESGNWYVNEMHEADEVAILNLLSVLRNAAIKQPVPLSGKDQMNELIDSMGITVKVYSDTYRLRLPGGYRLFPRKKMTIGLIVGPESPDGESTIMRQLNSSEPYEVHIPGGSGTLRSRFTPDESFWRNPVIINLQANEIKYVETIVPDNEDESFKIISNNDKGILVLDLHGEEIADTLLNHDRLISYIRSFYGLFYESLLDDDELADIRQVMMSDPFMVITIADKAGNKVTISCHYLDISHSNTLLPVNSPYDPNRFVLQLDHQGYAIAQFLVFNRIQRPLSYFLIR